MALDLSFLASALVMAALMLAERLWPNRQYVWSWRWVLRVFGIYVASLAFTAILGTLVGDSPRAYVASRTISAALASWPDWAAGLLAYLVVTFFVYWWHRARHASTLCWRLFHQVHHSPHRLQVITALYAHPTDYLSNTLIVSVVSFVLLGLGPDAAMWATFWVGAFELWEHTNVRTPRWLGFIVVRPEMHRVHHERDRHAKNYAIPVWDMLFGTYENSRRDVDCGFSPDREERLQDMLLFRDVHAD